MDALVCSAFDFLLHHGLIRINTGSLNFCQNRTPQCKAHFCIKMRIFFKEFV